MKKYNHKEAIKDYINFEDLLQKCGYTNNYKPQISNLGKALLKASNNQGRYNFLKRYWDNYFRELRQRKRDRQVKNKDVQKQNG